MSGAGPDRASVVPDVVHEHVVRRVEGPLAPYVASLHGYRVDGLAPGTHVGMPSRSVTLVVDLDGPLRLTVPGMGEVALQSVVGGLTDEPTLVHHDGHQYGVQAALTPAGARALLGVPAGALPEAVALEDLLGADARRLRERLVELDGWPERLTLVLGTLQARIGVGGVPGEPPAEVAEAWRLLASRHGDIPVSSLARRVGWSTRHLGERFGAEYGLRPKQAARVMRFERSHELVRRTTGRGRAGGSLAEIAAVCGYADQAHLTREWQALAGTTPGRWPHEDALANLQDAPRLVARG